MMRHGSRVGETAELIRLLSAVESMRHPTGRGALADELNLAYAHDLFRNRYVVNRADLSVPEIVTALMTMTDWPRILRHEVCGIRTDLFPEPEQAVAELLAFLARLLRRTGAGTVANDLENSVRRLLNVVVDIHFGDFREIFHQVTGRTTDKSLPAECAAELIPGDYEMLCEFLYRLAHLSAQTVDDAEHLRKWCADNATAMGIDSDRLKKIRDRAEEAGAGARRHLVVQLENAFDTSTGLMRLCIWQYLDSRSTIGQRPAAEFGKLVAFKPDPPGVTLDEALLKLSEEIGKLYDPVRMEPVVEVVLPEDRLNDHVERWLVPPPVAAGRGSDPVPLGTLVPLVVRPLPAEKHRPADGDPHARWQRIFARPAQPGVAATLVLETHSATIAVNGTHLCVAAGPGVQPDQISNVLSRAWQTGIRLMIWHRQHGQYNSAFLQRCPLEALPDYFFERRKRPVGCGYVLVWDNPYWVPDYESRRLQWSCR